MEIGDNVYIYVCVVREISL